MVGPGGSSLHPVSQPANQPAGDGRPLLAVVPVHLRAEAEAELLMRCLVSLWRTAPDVQVLVVDAASPAREIAAQLPPVCAEVGADLVRHDEPVTRGTAVNTGLRRALELGRDALVVAADVLFLDEPWLAPMRESDAAVKIHQRDATLWIGRVSPEGSVTVPAAPFVHVFVALGSADFDGIDLEAGDAVRLTDAGEKTFSAGIAGAELVIWETHSELQ